MSKEISLSEKVQLCSLIVACTYGSNPEVVPDELYSRLGEGWSATSALQFLGSKKFQKRSVLDGAGPDWYEISRAAKALYYLSYELGHHGDDVIFEVTQTLADRIGTLIGTEIKKQAAGHVEKHLLKAVHPLTGKVMRQKWVYDRYTAECFAADWHMKAPTWNANIYIGETLIYGNERVNHKKLEQKSFVVMAGERPIGAIGQTESGAWDARPFGSEWNHPTKFDTADEAEGYVRQRDLENRAK
ncbi:hypothetical protein ACT43E_20815 (plasmid) [Acinetobacter baumannii]